MKKQMKSFSCFLLCILSGAFQSVSAQCNPNYYETCAEANENLLCSLTALNGVSCSNLSTIPSLCGTICSSGGAANGTSWWAFVTAGGNVSISLTAGSCNLGLGLEFGVWGNCACGEEIICRSPGPSPGNTITASANLTSCKKYYFWIDGINSDVCDFTIGISGGGPPTMSPLGKINNDADMVIDVCEGVCMGFFVNAQTGTCPIKYDWSWDGNPLSEHYRSFETDLPYPPGDYTLCATSYFEFGSTICSQMQQCATIRIRRNPDKPGLTRTICNELANPGGFKWHAQRIYNSGVYKQGFTEGNCCKYDSVVQFNVLETPQPANVYYIGCDSKPFVDITGKAHKPCLFSTQVALPKTTTPYKCDSSILLTSVNVEIESNWSVRCIGGMVELNPNVKILKPCFVGESYEFEYKWYKKSDPMKVLETNERLLVKAVSEEYSLEVKIRTQLETATEVCTWTLDERFDESNMAPDCSFTLEAEKIFCFDPVGTYRIKNLSSPNILFHNWTIDGGFIVSNPDSAVVDIKWLLRPTDTGRVCVSYDTDCGTSCEKCITILFDTKIAGEDFEHRGLSAYLDAKPNPNGMWRLISGPNPVRIEDPTFARTKITAFNYGYYCFEWTVTAPNCTLKDTLCVNLHNFKKASPEYPKLLFFERVKSTDDADPSSKIVFTPNLIQNNGESFISIESENGKVNYHWFDIYGRLITQNEQVVESGLQRLTIHSPMNEGMYFLVIEIDGVTSVRKVCVIE